MIQCFSSAFLFMKLTSIKMLLQYYCSLFYDSLQTISSSLMFDTKFYSVHIIKSSFFMQQQLLHKSLFSCLVFIEIYCQLFDKNKLKLNVLIGFLSMNVSMTKFGVTIGFEKGALKISKKKRARSNWVFKQSVNLY